MQHYPGIVQQIHLLVCCPHLLRPPKFLHIVRYPELRELELKQLARVLSSSDSSATFGLLKNRIKCYTHGELPHAENIFPALYKLMESEESVEEIPLPAVASSNRNVTTGDWDELNMALTSSLTSGTFLDSQFYAVESRSPVGFQKIRPIYFCSAVGGNFTSKLVACEFLENCMGGLLIRHSRFLKTRGTESATSSMCRWL